MCGIVGYTGPRQAAPLLLEGLRRLEYRGYDSAGLALIEDGRIDVYKAAGKISVLEKALGTSLPAGHTGIAHTRWATHGAPNTVNAHPHTDCGGTLALVHNGIIERSEEHTSELQSRLHLVCRLLLEKKKQKLINTDVKVTYSLSARLSP